jgi:hypothetical protein
MALSAFADEYRVFRKNGFLQITRYVFTAANLWAVCGHAPP